MYKLYKNIVGLLKQIKDSLFSLFRGTNDKSVGYEPTSYLLSSLLKTIDEYSSEEIKFRFSYCGKRKTFSVHVRDKDDIPSMFVVDGSSQFELTRLNIDMATYWVWSKRLEILELELYSALTNEK